jgi:hypothetical protein
MPQVLLLLALLHSQGLLALLMTLQDLPPAVFAQLLLVALLLRCFP